MEEQERTLFGALLHGGLTPEEKQQIKPMIPFFILTIIISFIIAWFLVDFISPWHNVKGYISNNSMGFYYIESGVTYSDGKIYNVTYIMSNSLIFCNVRINDFLYIPNYDPFPSEPYASIINKTAPLTSCK